MVTKINGTTGIDKVQDGVVGILEADQWRLTSDVTTNGDITSNLERVDNATFAKIGTGMSESSGIFTFPSTGLYLVQLKIAVNTTGTDTIGVQTFVSSDGGSNYNALNNVQCGQVGTGALVNHASGIDFVNVINAANFKVKFNVSSLSSGLVDGSTDLNLTTFTFIKLGNAQ